MLTKVVPILRVASRMQLFSHSRHGVPAHWKPMKEICLENKSHMNCLPVPEGCWQEEYNKVNAKRNLALLISVVFLIATSAAMWPFMYLHTAPPMYNCKKPKS